MINRVIDDDGLLSLSKSDTCTVQNKVSFSTEVMYTKVFYEHVIFYEMYSISAGVSVSSPSSITLSPQIHPTFPHRPHSAMSVEDAERRHYAPTLALTTSYVELRTQ